MNKKPQSASDETFSIIICDDDPDDQFLLSSALKAAKVECDILTVNNGLELLDLLLHREKNQYPKPALIFLDVNMPLLDGFGVLRELKNHRNLKKIPAYVFSTSSLADDKRKAIALGARDYYIKPADFDHFKKMVKSICDAHFSTKKV